MVKSTCVKMAAVMEMTDGMMFAERKVDCSDDRAELKIACEDFKHNTWSGLF